MAETTSHLQVAFYVPNLIGYFRFLFLAMAPWFVFSDEKWILYIAFYLSSEGLDALDGKAARALDQCSRFGAALDMVCDRACNSMMFFFLAVLYKDPVVSFLFVMCFILDFGSHWLQFLSSAFCKSVSHKGKNKKENWLVGLYYNNYTIFLCTCVGAEIAAITLFINVKATWLQEHLVWNVIVAFWSSILAFKMFVNVHQWQGGVERLYQHSQQLEMEKA